MKTQNVIVLFCLWGGYFVIHSLLASISVKQWLMRILPERAHYYRIAFNIIAILLLIVPAGFMIAKGGEVIWDWPLPLKWLANLLALAAVIVFIWTFRYYDMYEFLGVKQSGDCREGVFDQEIFKVSPFHRYVRHPWYFLVLVVIWTRDMDYMVLTTAIALSVYFFVGSRLEERKLIIYHGEVYRRYCEKVPGIIPRPWRYLTKEQTRSLLALQRGDKTQ
jgi:protein-S-isoprenylcysteine O-methyltransferase Ste14